MEATFSPYKIAWIEFRATKGVVTKKDRTILTKFHLSHLSGTREYMHFPTKEKAEEYLATIQTNKLTKSYEVRIFTDKQFGMMKLDVDKSRFDDSKYHIPFTEAQEKEMKIIGNKKTKNL